MNINIEVKKRHLVIILALFLMGIAYASVDPSLPWHPASEIVLNSTGEDLETAFADLNATVYSFEPPITDYLETAQLQGRVVITGRYNSGGSHNWCYYKAYVGSKIIIPADGEECSSTNCPHSIGHTTLTCDKSYNDIKSDVKNAFADYADENTIELLGKTYIPLINDWNKGTCDSSCQSFTFDVVYKEITE